MSNLTSSAGLSGPEWYGTAEAPACLTAALAANVLQPSQMPVGLRHIGCHVAERNISQPFGCVLGQP